VSAAALLLTSGLALGQSTTKDAAEAFNAGVTANEAKNYTEAVIQFNKALDICSQVGAEADEIKLQAEKVIPSVEFNIGLGLYNQKKIEEAISQIDKAKELAIKYGDEKTQKKAERVVPQLYNFLGNGALRDGQYDKAIEFYGKAIALDANYSKCYLGMGLAYSKMNNLDKAIESFDKTIEVGTATNKTETLRMPNFGTRQLVNSSWQQNKRRKILPMPINTLANRFNMMIEARMLTLDLLLPAINYPSFDDAIENINKALPLLEGSSDSIKAPYYFALGNAFLGKKDNTNACDAYKKRRLGPLKKRAEYQIKEVLKCQ